MKRHARARYSVRLPVTPVSAQSQVRTRAEHTEDQLTQWRSVAAGRRRAFELAQWIEAEKLRRKRRRFVRGLRGVVTTVMVIALSVGAIALQPGRQAEARARASVVSAAESAVAVVEPHAPAAALPILEPPRFDAIIETPVGPGWFMGPNDVPTSSDRVVGIDRASVKQWDDPTYRWVTFEVATTSPTWMRWRDASGAYPIEAMPCAYPTETSHTCRAGRSHDRLRRALAEGAVPGTWTIEACVGDECEPVDTVVIGVP